MTAVATSETVAKVEADTVEAQEADAVYVPLVAPEASITAELPALDIREQAGYAF